MESTDVDCSHRTCLNPIPELASLVFGIGTQHLRFHRRKANAHIPGPNGVAPSSYLTPLSIPAAYRYLYLRPLSGITKVGRTISLWIVTTRVCEHPLEFLTLLRNWGQSQHHGNITASITLSAARVVSTESPRISVPHVSGDRRDANIFGGKTDGISRFQFPVPASRHCLRGE